MLSLIGEYDCKLDPKGRFLFPAALKKQLDAADQDQFVLNRGFEGCLVLYPNSSWAEESKNMSKLNLYKAEHRKFYRQFHNGATLVKPDNLGRILIPKNLKLFANIQKELVVFAYAKRIEIWAKEHYIAHMQEDVSDFAQLAERVMQNLGDDQPEH